MESFVSEARTICERLSRLDLRRVAFGARSHGYTFAPCLTEAEVAEAEQRHGLTLPPPYRAFITRLGNGGVGPQYGIGPFRVSEEHQSRPFPHTAPFQLTEDTLDDLLPGAARLADCGCGIEIVLVLNGPAAGQVWLDARYEGGISPLRDAARQPLTFDAWWLHDMRALLARFETIAALMHEGTLHEEIHAKLEPRELQLHVDEAMASLMDRDPTGRPPLIPSKPWGLICGQVDVLYRAWLANRTQKPRPPPSDPADNKP
ncbi:Hypothetical protein CAP_1859 [Chondromyces apiculatus DSM 436]|uniref:Knr4/Smi1-like domain-containing protein n=2 Tax=Chondromyces apiculatus TaxID=51 RepID=A0A017ST91_9BACT|nr:Hypothetical protein CAP_1859 [Chondromyces apiculatus DSM 436]